MNKLFWLVKWKILRDLIIKIIIAFVFTRHSYPVMCLAFSMLHRYTMHSANEAEATGCRQNVKKATSYLNFNVLLLPDLFISLRSLPGGFDIYSAVLLLPRFSMLISQVVLVVIMMFDLCILED